MTHSVRPLTDGELHRLGTDINQRLQIARVLKTEDTQLLSRLERLITCEKVRRAESPALRARSRANERTHL